MGEQTSERTCENCGAVIAARTGLDAFILGAVVLECPKCGEPL